MSGLKYETLLTVAIIESLERVIEGRLVKDQFQQSKGISDAVLRVCKIRCKKENSDLCELGQASAQLSIVSRQAPYILAFYDCYYCSLVEDVSPACLILGHGRICASCFAHQ